MALQIRKASEVFVVGGQPTITYYPRSQLKLEQRLTDYLDDGYKLISVTGPTKCGKTVLCHSVIPAPEAVWVPGGQVQSEDEFWRIILDKLAVPISRSEQTTEEESTGSGTELGGGLNLPGIQAGGKATGTSGSKSGRSVTENLQTLPRTAAIRSLLDRGMKLVIDDFHYIHDDVQKSIIHALKEPIFEGLRVLVLAVPHRGDDPLRVEAEMTGRVGRLDIPQWDPTELETIANQGFPALNVTCPLATIQRLASESFGSPHLMQEFCLGLCRENDVRETQASHSQLQPPRNYQDFFRTIAVEKTSKVAFERLARGPRPRADRQQRTFADGRTGDIYVAVLEAIAQAGPKSQMTYEDVRGALKGVLLNMPQANEVTSVLANMSRIAKGEVGTEPVIDWHEGILHIVDPFFAFYLRWGR